MGNFKQGRIWMPFSHTILQSVFLSQIKVSCVVFPFLFLLVSPAKPKARQWYCKSQHQVFCPVLQSRKPGVSMCLHCVP